MKMGFAKENIYDLAFVGSGIACTYTIIHFINILDEAPLNEKVKILVVEKADEFWVGIPYGNRSGFNSLIITSLKDFLSVDELELFKTWLKQNVSWVFKDFQKRNGTLSSDWLENNERLLAENDWDNLYLPRYVFGYFLRERVTTLLESAVKKNLLEYQLLSADVINIQKNDAIYKLTVQDDFSNRMEIESSKIILSIGSPPKKNLCTLENYESLLGVNLIEDLYHPKIEVNIKRIYETFKKSENKEHNNILIVGSNASALEAAYNIMDISGMDDLVNKFYFLSRDGAFPYRSNNGQINLDDYTLVALNSLKNASKITSKQILEAVKKDVELMKTLNVNIADIIYHISNIINELVVKLSPFEQKIFVNKDGVEIGKFQRKAGKEYCDLVDNLSLVNKLENLKGKFVRLVFQEEKFDRIEYVESHTLVKKTFDKPVKFIINCCGFEDLAMHSSSELIRSLIINNICRTNSSKRGFTVNENFEADNNFFIMGPLLAGNSNKHTMIWHVESCTRICFLSKQLARVLVNTYQADGELPQKTL
jgi:uncharacterized NAD(P)/FAD-binding protein YdhS